MLVEELCSLPNEASLFSVFQLSKVSATLGQLAPVWSDVTCEVQLDCSSLVYGAVRMSGQQCRSAERLPFLLPKDPEKSFCLCGAVCEPGVDPKRFRIY